MGLQSAECRVQSAECRVQIHGLWNEDCRVGFATGAFKPAIVNPVIANPVIANPVIANLQSTI